MTTTPRQADDGPPLPPPRWKASRGPRGCGGNLLLVLVGLIGIVAAFCIFSGGFVDWAIRKAIADGAFDEPKQESLFGNDAEPPPSRLPVRQGLRPESTTRQPERGQGETVQPDERSKEPESKPSGGGLDEDALFGVQ